MQLHEEMPRSAAWRTAYRATALDAGAARRYIGAMFTGIVEATGALAAREARGAGARLTVRGRLNGGPLELGESIAVDGCCLTVAAAVTDGFEVDASVETMARTTLGALPVGSPLNLERALRAGDRLGGHFATGHVDGVGALIERHPIGDAVAMTFAVPAKLARFVAEKGSISVNGVSLTVNLVTDANRFDVILIPTTIAATNLGGLAPGNRVNLEVDLIARYVARLMDPGPARIDDPSTSPPGRGYDLGERVP